MPKTIQTGLYKHYKGKLYQVIGIAHHSETQEELVVYRALYDDPEFGTNAMWVRPATMFMETIEVHGTTMPRFTFIKE